MAHRSLASALRCLPLAFVLASVMGRTQDVPPVGALEVQAEAEWETNTVTGLSAPAIGGVFSWTTSLGTVATAAVAAGWTDEGSGAPLPREEELRHRVETIAAPAMSAALLRADWGAVAAALDAIRELPSPAAVRAVEMCLEDLEASLDAFLTDLEATDADQADLAWLLARAGELERHADRLETVASRVRLYSKGSAAAALAAHLEETVKALADADRKRYLEGLRRLAAEAEATRGAELRRDAADSIRSGCDTLIRRLSAGTANRSLDLSASNEILDFTLEASFAAMRTATASPSGGTGTLSAAGAASYEFGDEEIGISFGTRKVVVDDRLCANSAEIVSEAEAFAEWRLGEADFEARIAVEQERRPLQIDAEVEAAAVGDVRKAAEVLAGEVSAAALLRAAERLLLADLTAVRVALDEGRRDAAADAIEDFIDHVESERWKGNVSSAAAARWTERAAGIQPRRSVRRLEIPVSVEVPVSDGSVDVELEWATTAYPANSVLSTTKSAVAATWSTKRDDWSIDTSAERTRTHYPAASTKDAATSELALEVEKPLAVGELALATQIAHQVRPTAPENDRDDATVSGSWSGTWSGLSWTLEASGKTTRYPNDPPRLETRTRASTLDATLPFAGGNLGVTWETENARTSDGNPDQDTSVFSVAWECEAGDVEVSLSADWEVHTDWAAPGKDRRSLKLAAEISIPF